MDIWDRLRGVSPSRPEGTQERSAPASKGSTNGQDDGGKRAADRPGRWVPYLTVTPVLGLGAMVVYAASLASASVFAVAFLVAGGAFLAGSLLGFLFGIPRLLAGEQTGIATQEAATTAEISPGRSPYQSNTNLEQISDWLTKILVGVGLVELGRLSSATGQLIDFLAPALGDTASSPAFALGLLALYTISGFLIVYLITRVYLGSEFARADQLMNRIGQVEKKQDEQQADMAAMNQAIRFIDADLDDSTITPKTLARAIKDASNTGRSQIFYQARQRRLHGTPEQRERTAEVFRALAASDVAGRWHRNHGQLGYALLATDPAAAEKALTTAIERRNKVTAEGYETYDLARAKSRIALDPKNETTELSDPNLMREVLADLQRAYRASWTHEDILDPNGAIRPWLERNNLAESDLATSMRDSDADAR